MKIRVTGEERDVANSAWVSTLNEIRAKAKTQEDVLRVVNFLVEHHHTSPFESVTITFDLKDSDPNLISSYQDNPYARCSEDKLTIDLLNFIKTTFKKDIWNEHPWKMFKEVRPTLAGLAEGFGHLPDEPADDVAELLGDHGMSVELVHLHDEGSDYHSRATWRIKCPLSIAVQILRHRSGSYNMVSGRYKTIRQEMYKVPDDVRGILNKAKLFEGYENIESSVDEVINEYLHLMKDLRAAKKDGLISNDEYKRARECVRFVLPEGRMTELYVTYYLSDFYQSYKKLRDSVHAQTEHIYISQEMARTLKR